VQDSDGAALLDSALDQLRLEGAIFFRSELTEAFAFESTPLALADALHPGATRLILFHIVAQGNCWVSDEDGERHWASQGDVIVLPYGDRHVIGGEAPAVPVPIIKLLDPLPWSDLPLLRHGGGGRRTDLVCGYLYSEDPLFDPAMRALPSVFVVRLPKDSGGHWVEASITYALENTQPDGSPAGPIATRLPELVLIEVLRSHLASAPGVRQGWLAALRDQVLGPALALLHSSPEQKWTVADLAAQANVSRSLLDERFRRVLGRSPIRYLTEWRMHVAEDLLDSDISVLSVARRVGYDSEEAFSRAFKRAHGLSPSHWRKARTSSVAN
jgi:AraC-like DNA-binding protein